MTVTLSPRLLPAPLLRMLLLMLLLLMLLLLMLLQGPGDPDAERPQPRGGLVESGSAHV